MVSNLITYQELEEKTKSGAPAEDVRDMLLCYGFKQDPKNPKKWSNSIQPGLVFGINLTNSTISGDELKCAIGSCRTAETRGFKPQIPIEPVPDWVTKVLPKGYKAAMNSGILKVWDGHPELPFRMRLDISDVSDVSESKAQSALSTRLAEYQFLIETHQELLNRLDLKAEFGVTLERDESHHQLRLPNHVMGMEEMLSFSSGDEKNNTATEKDREKISYVANTGWSAPFSDGSNEGNGRLAIELKKLADHLADYTIICNERLEALGEHGFTCKHSDSANGVTTEEYQHPNLNKHLIIKLHGKHKRLDVTDLQKLDQAIEDSQKPVLRQSKSKLFSDYVPRIKNELPEHEKAVLIMDASVLDDMAEAPREQSRGGLTRTWLDALPPIADLDQVDRMMISATIELETTGAYWEQGNTINDAGNLNVVDHTFKSGHELYEKSRPQDGLFKTASRYSVDENGKWTQTKAGNPHIVICETPFDREIIKKVKERYPHGGIFEQNFRKSLKDYGERSMEYLAERVDTESSVYMVSTDFTWMHDRAHQKSETGCPPTIKGAAIGEVSRVGLLNAAFPSHHDKIKQCMEDQFGIPVCEGRMEDAIMAATNQKSESYCSPGIDADGNIGQTLEKLLSGPRSKAATMSSRDDYSSEAMGGPIRYPRSSWR